MIPSNEHGPGAKEARAAHYIDRALAGPVMNQRGVYAAGLSALHSHFDLGRHLVDRQIYKERRSAALTDWQVLAS